ncbi:MAG: RNA polymerase sigma factor [Kofleriaceae bacterium]|nr:RNA polymerase sigma factor [Kofleriaceae bacterium]
MGAIARSDTELVEASLRGEHEAFGDLVARYQDVVCAVSYSSTGDQVLSEDVAQETFIAAWRQLDRLRNSARIRPWLCGIARNLARTARKRRRREPLVDADEQPGSGASPFDVAARGDVERVVREALERIPAAYREALILYYREDLSVRAIAETLGVSEENAMQRLSRGRRHLAESVTDVVERSLRGERRRRDLVAAVLASIAAITLPSRVDASPTKGSTMLKFAVAASAVVAVGTTAYLVHTHSKSSTTSTAAVSPPTVPPKLSYGSGKLGLAHAPTLGPSAAPRAIASRSVAEADLALLPADSDAVIGLNFAQLRQSQIWRTYVAPTLVHADGFREFETLCGFNPVESLGSVSLGVKSLGGDDQSAVVIMHGFDRAKARSCFDSKGIAAVEKEGAKVTVDGDVVLIGGKGHADLVAFTFIDNTTALVVMGPDAATKENVERIAAGNGGVQNSTKFSEALQVVNTDDSLWVMIADTSQIVTAVNAEHVSTKLGTMYMSLNVTDSLALDAGVRLGSPEAVAKLVAEIQKKMGEDELAKLVLRYFDQLDVMADGTDLIISMSVGGSQLTPLLSSLMLSGQFEIEDE